MPPEAAVGKAVVDRGAENTIGCFRLFASLRQRLNDQKKYAGELIRSPPRPEAATKGTPAPPGGKLNGTGVCASGP
jgi:hypothetical protein